MVIRGVLFKYRENDVRIHVLQHAEFETEAAIGQWAKKNNRPVTRTCLFNNESLPETASFDLLCIMGGPMNIYEEDRFPFLNREKKFIREAVAAGKKLLGICLGAQLLADCFGGRVFKNEYPEIGWHPVALTQQAEKTPFFRHFPDRFHAFHWHGDTFSIPDQAIHVLSSTACQNQGFVIKNKIIALQFHCEMLPESIEKIIRHCRNEIIPGKFVQSEEEMTKSETYRKFSPVSLGIMEQILSTFRNL